MRNFAVCLRFISMLPLFKIFCQKSVYETTEKKVKGRKKRMAQNWELKYNTGENKDFRSLARYDFQTITKELNNWVNNDKNINMIEKSVLGVLPNDTPNFS